MHDEPRNRSFSTPTRRDASIRFALDGEVVVDEVRRTRLLGDDPADRCRGEDQRLRPSFRHPILDLRLPRKSTDERPAVRISQRLLPRRRTIAEPTMPRWPATKTRLSRSE